MAGVPTDYYHISTGKIPVLSDTHVARSAPTSGKTEGFWLAPGTKWAGVLEYGLDYERVANPELREKTDTTQSRPYPYLVSAMAKVFGMPLPTSLPPANSTTVQILKEPLLVYKATIRNDTFVDDVTSPSESKVFRLHPGNVPAFFADMFATTGIATLERMLTSSRNEAMRGDKEIEKYLRKNTPDFATYFDSTFARDFLDRQGLHVTLNPSAESNPVGAGAGPAEATESKYRVNGDAMTDPTKAALETYIVRAAIADILDVVAGGREAWDPEEEKASILPISGNSLTTLGFTKAVFTGCAGTPDRACSVIPAEAFTLPGTTLKITTPQKAGPLTKDSLAKYKPANKTSGKLKANWKDILVNPRTLAQTLRDKHSTAIRTGLLPLDVDDLGIHNAIVTYLLSLYLSDEFRTKWGGIYYDESLFTMPFPRRSWVWNVEVPSMCLFRPVAVLGTTTLPEVELRFGTECPAEPPSPGVYVLKPNGTDVEVCSSPAKGGRHRGRTFRRTFRRRDKNGGRPTRKSKPRRHK